jgi:hypothetical protein
VDGDKVASFEADDEDEWLDDDAGEEEFRFSDLDLVLEEDEETEVVVAVSVMNSVDGSDAGDAAAWWLEPTSVRTFDADGVAETLDSIDEMSTGLDASERIEFNIEEEGADDGADLESSSDDPDAANLLVDEDSDDSDEFVVHVFDIEVDDESSDLSVDNAYATVTLANPTGAQTTTMDDVIEDVFMTINGETIEGEDTTNLGNTDSDTTDDGEIDYDINATESNSVQFLFEFDEDVTLESDEDYEVEISVVFKGQDGNYDNGVQVSTDVQGSDWEVEGSEDDNNLSGDDTSETHTLATVVPVITDTDFNIDKSEDDNSGTISYSFTMAADGENDITFSFDDVNNVTSAGSDLKFELQGTDTSIASATISQVAGDATLVGNDFTINDGEDADFVLDVTFTTVDAADNGTYRVRIDTIEGLEVDETSSGMTLSFSS